MSATTIGSQKSQMLDRFSRLPPGFPIKLIIGLALIISMDTFVQLAWKIAATSLPDTLSLSAIVEVLQHPLLLVVIGMMLCQLFIWLMVLGQADLSFAQPFFSLSRITVCIASVYVLHEPIEPAQMLGILLVCAGAWCISRSPRMTGGGENTPS
jgi:drug/metabolite transporter (DMT)-like permease